MVLKDSRTASMAEVTIVTMQLFFLCNKRAVQVS